MKKFFHSLFTTTLSIFIAMFLILLVGAGIIGASIGHFKKDKTVVLKPNSVLQLTLNKPVPDRTSDNPFEHFDFGSMKSDKPLGLNDMLASIEAAKTDDDIKGIYLDVSHVLEGTATKQEIRNSLLNFKESGKFVVAYSEAFGQSTYWLASAADEIYMHPEGYMEFKGLSATTPFFTGMLNKLEIEPQVIRHGKFKSAIEPFVLNEMSEENRLQTEKFVGSIWEEVVQDISETRELKASDINQYVDSLLVTLAEDANQYDLVDDLLYEDAVQELLMEKVGVEDEGNFNIISLSKYHKSLDIKEKTDEDSGNDSKIAVIYAKGGIRSGEGDEDEIASETISKVIKEAREDDDVKAVVFRINSGGGSALASDVIWREIELTKKEKPVVASFGNVAASGGYYIACGADKIVANPTTITGSIGVFGLMFNMQDFYDHKLGITFDKVKTNDYSDMGSSSRPMTDYEINVMQDLVEDVYDDFISKVAEGRNLTKNEVDEIGQGRVWSGIDALEIGLVDKLGGLEDAIDLAAELAGLQDFKIQDLPKQKNPFEMALSLSSEETKMKLLTRELGPAFKQYQAAQKILNQTGIQMLMPYQIELN